MQQVDSLAEKRMNVIMKVKNGLMTAEQASAELNVSRTTYYKWEAKALLAMYEAVTNSEVGRPCAVQDPEKEKLNEEIRILRREILFLQQDREIRKILFGDINPGVEEEITETGKKKDSRRKRGRKGIAKGKRRR